MLHKIAAILQSGGQHLLSAVGAVGPADRTEQLTEHLLSEQLPGHLPGHLIDALVQASAPSGEQMVVRLRTAFAVLAVFEAIYLLEVAIFEPRLLVMATCFCTFDVALMIAAFGTTYLTWFKRHWRWVTMALCLGVIASRTLMGIAIDEDEPLLMALFAIVVGTAMLVPWDLRWQGGLSVAGLFSFTVVSLTGEVDPGDVQRWMILAMTMAFGLSFISLKKHHLLKVALIERLKSNEDRMGEQIKDLTATHARLRVEVAERQAAERIASERELTLRQLFDAVPDLVTLTRLTDGKFLEVNAEFLRRTGMSREKALETSTLEIGQWVRPQEREAFLQRLRTDGHVRELEVDFLFHGIVVPYLASSVVVDLNGEACALGVGHDIAQIKESERALREAQLRLRTQVDELTATQHNLVVAREAALAASRAKSEFLSSMSHEIRTPMNAILGMADLLWDDRTLNSEQRRYLDVMRSNGNALLHLINDILDLAKIESGRLSLESVGFDLEELVDKTLETMSVRAHAKGLELTARILPAVECKLLGDPLRLGQILINLLGNAIKFTDQGEVALAVEALEPAADTGPAAGRLRFSISDTGIGIAADKLGTIFSGFSQADSSISRRFGGSGLGLTIVTRLTRLMGGIVEVASTPGRGSIFSVTVTLAADPHPVVVERRPAVRLDGARILIVDDNETNRLILRETLTRAGAEPGEAASGEAGLAELARAHAAGRPYRLMLLDYRMPGMDGAEVARRVLAECPSRAPGDRDDARENLIILMLTSEDLNFQFARLRELGLQTYLIKPVKRLELVDSIGKLLSGVAPVQPRPSPGAPSPALAAERPLRILLAEDSPDNRLLIRAYFKDLPYALETAENGRIAIDKFKASPHDLILMDVQMPVMDGLTATRAMRQWERDQRLARTPIVALTASALDEDIKRSLAAGCDLHVSKPVRKRVLLEAIHLAVGAARAEANAAGVSAHPPMPEAAPMPAEFPLN